MLGPLQTNHCGCGSFKYKPEPHSLHGCRDGGGNGRQTDGPCKDSGHTASDAEAPAGGSGCCLPQSVPRNERRDHRHRRRRLGPPELYRPRRAHGDSTANCIRSLWVQSNRLSGNLRCWPSCVPHVSCAEVLRHPLRDSHISHLLGILKQNSSYEVLLPWCRISATIRRLCVPADRDHVRPGFHSVRGEGFAMLAYAVSLPNKRRRLHAAAEFRNTHLDGLFCHNTNHF